MMTARRSFLTCPGFGLRRPARADPLGQPRRRACAVAARSGLGGSAGHVLAQMADAVAGAAHALAPVVQQPAQAVDDRRAALGDPALLRLALQHGLEVLLGRRGEAAASAPALARRDRVEAGRFAGGPAASRAGEVSALAGGPGPGGPIVRSGDRVEIVVGEVVVGEAEPVVVSRCRGPVLTLGPGLPGRLRRPRGLRRCPWGQRILLAVAVCERRRPVGRVAVAGSGALGSLRLLTVGARAEPATQTEHAAAVSSSPSSSANSSLPRSSEVAEGVEGVPLARAVAAGVAVSRSRRGFPPVYVEVEVEVRVGHLSLSGCGAGRNSRPAKAP